MTGRWIIPIGLLSFGVLVVALLAYMSGSAEVPLSKQVWSEWDVPSTSEIDDTPADDASAGISVKQHHQPGSGRGLSRPRARGLDQRAASARQLAGSLAGRLDEAAVRWRSNLAHGPLARTMGGWADLQAGRYAAAIAGFDKVLTRQPENAPALSGKANALVALDRFEEALSIYERVIQLAPGDADARYNTGVLLYRRGRFAEATGHFRKLVGIDPAHARGQYNLATLAQRAGRIAEARDAWEAFTRLEPGVASAWFNLGVILMDFDEPVRAVDCFARCVDLSPDDPEGWLNLALAYAAAGRLQLALEMLTIADDLLPCDEAIMGHLAYLHDALADSPGGGGEGGRRLAGATAFPAVGD